MKGLTETLANELAKGLGILQAAIVCLFLVFSPLSFAQDMDSELSIELEQVNVNHADAETIAQVLNGIGLRKAEAIIAYRDENGSYASVNDLVLVKGIGEATVLKNQERILFE